MIIIMIIIMIILIVMITITITIASIMIMIMMIVMKVLTIPIISLRTHRRPRGLHPGPAGVRRHRHRLAPPRYHCYE